MPRRHVSAVGSPPVTLLQESTSEAINAWYGMQLYGEAVGNNNLKQTGRVLLAHELEAARVYWRATDSQMIYPYEFARHKGGQRPAPRDWVLSCSRASALLSEGPACEKRGSSEEGTGGGMGLRAGLLLRTRHNWGWRGAVLPPVPSPP